MSNNNLIICTGFDIFEGHTEKNASWEAVKLLPNFLNFKNREFILKKIKVPVSYKGVDEIVPEIWTENPKLVIHCGVSSLASKVTLEACAYNLGYCRPDFNSKYLPGSRVEGIRKEILLTNFNVNRIAKELNQVLEVDDACKCEIEEPIQGSDDQKNDKNSKFICSKDVGSYLCGYIYLKSLDQNLDRTLFIHVPAIGTMPSEETQERIFQTILKCLEQLDEVELL